MTHYVARPPKFLEFYGKFSGAKWTSESTFNECAFTASFCFHINDVIGWNVVVRRTHFSPDTRLAERQAHSSAHQPTSPASVSSRLLLQNASPICWPYSFAEFDVRYSEWLIYAPVTRWIPLVGGRRRHSSNWYHPTNVWIYLCALLAYTIRLRWSHWGLQNCRTQLLIKITSSMAEIYAAGTTQFW